MLHGIIILSPIFNKLLVKLLYFFISSTVVLYFFEILYNESPFFTVYTIHSSGFDSLLLVTLNTCPAVIVLFLRLFSFLIDSTDVLNLLEIPYKVSPFCTV